jgi:hypothetical protein
MMKGGIAALSLFSKIIMIEYLTSEFIIPCSIFVIRFFIVSLSICLDARGQRLRSYETTPKWHSRVGLRADHIAGGHNRTNPAGTETRPTTLSSFIFD